MEIALAIVAALLAVVAAILAARLAAARQSAAEAQARADAAAARLDASVETRVESEGALRAARQRIGDLEAVLKDAETARQNLVTAARSAALETARELSAQLIGDHKRETEAARQEAEQRARKITEPLVQQVEGIVKAVAALDGQMREKARVLDTVWRSLTSPSGSGQIAEIGLANTLKDFGLEAGRDYLLQATTTGEISGKRLRPDALVFLPGNSVVVIDCKASKYLIEIAEAEGGESEAEAYANLARTMNQHLKALADKDYRGAVLAEWRASGRPGEVSHVHSVMYLPNEAVLEKLARADAAFFARARKEDIMPAGPVGLHCVLSAAAAEITKERQVANQQRILDAAQKLLDGVRLALNSVADVGKGIKAAAESYQKLTSSINQRLLPRARGLNSLGVPLPPGKTLPHHLPAYTVMSQEGDQLIEGEAAEVAEEPPAPRLLAE